MSVRQKVFSDPVRTLLVALAVSLPFEYIPTTLIGGLRIRFSVVIGFVLILIAAWQILSRKLRPPRFITTVIVLWVVWLIVGAFRFIDWQRGTKVLIPLVFFALLSISIGVLMKRQYIRPVIYGVISGASLAALFGLYQYFGNIAGLPETATGLREVYSWERFGFPRMQSTGLEPLYFSNYLLLPIALCAAFFIKTSKQKRMFGGLLFLFVTINILTLSRGGIAAFIVLSIVLAALLWKWRPVRLFWPRMGVVIIIFIAAVGTSLLVIAAVARKGIDPDVTYNKTGVSTFVSHIDNTSFTATEQNKKADDSINQRNVARESARRLLSDDPAILFFGTGAGQYNSLYEQRYGTGSGAPNNVVLEQLIQTGIIGLLLLGTIALWIVVNLGRLLAKLKRDSDMQVLVLALLGYWIAVGAQLQTFSGIGLTHVWFSIGISIFLIQSFQDIRAHAHKTSSQKNKD